MPCCQLFAAGSDTYTSYGYCETISFGGCDRRYFSEVPLTDSEFTLKAGRIRRHFVYCSCLLFIFTKCGEPIGDSGSRVVSGTILREKRLASAAVIIRKQRCPLTRFLVAETTKSGQKLCKKTLPVTRNFGTMRMKKCRLLVRVPPRGDIL